MTPNGVSKNPYAEVFDYAKPAPTREQVQESRRRLRLAETGFRLHRLSQSKRLLENLFYGGYDWVGSVSDRLDRLRIDPNEGSPISSPDDRKFGKNYPLFANEAQLNTLRMQSRILCSTNCYAIGLQEGILSYTLGVGLSYRAMSKQQERPAPEELLHAIQEIVDDHHERNAWFGGEQPGLEEELAWRSTEDGEWFLRHYAMPDGTTELRLVEPEQISQGDKGEMDWLFGIQSAEKDPTRHLAYNVLYQEGNGYEYEVVDADEIVAYRRNVRRNVKRGMPDYSFATLDAFHVADKLRNNMALGAAIQAAIAGVRQHDTATQGEVQGMVDLAADYQQTNVNTNQRENVRKFIAGIEDVPKGQNWVNPPTAQNAAAHVEILLACLRGAGRRWNPPDWLIAGDASNANYASSLVGESPFVLRIKRHQKHLGKPFELSAWIAVRNWVSHHNGLLVRIAQRDAQGAKTGTFGERRFTWEEIRKLVELQVEAPDPEAHNKLEDANVRQIERLNGVLSVQTWQQKAGYDSERELANQEEYLEKTGGQGLAIPIPKDKPGPGTDILLDPQLALQAALQPPKAPAQPAAPPAAEPAPQPAQESRTVREQVEPVILDIPDIRQNDGYTCGVASLQAVLDYFGVSTEDDELEKHLGTTPEDGTEPGPIAACAQSHGLAVQAGPMDLDTLRAHLDAGHPVICCVQYDAPDGWASGHYVVVIGHAGDVLTIQDPARGRVRELADEFVRRWHDLAADGPRLEQYGIAIGRTVASVPSVKESASHVHFHAGLKPEQITSLVKELTAAQGLHADQLSEAVNLALEKQKTPIIEFPVEKLTKLLEAVIPEQQRPVVNFPVDKLADAILKLANKEQKAPVVFNEPRIEIKVEPEPIEPVTFDVVRDREGKIDKIREE